MSLLSTVPIIFFVRNLKAEYVIQTCTRLWFETQIACRIDLVTKNSLDAASFHQIYLRILAVDSMKRH